MSDREIFQMWEPTRQHLIANHRFYVSEAKSRLLDQFSEPEMQAAADRHAEEWLAKTASSFDPDRDDPASAYEDAHDRSIVFYQSLSELQSTTRLSIIAGMYHEWEKQLRHHVAREFSHFLRGDHTQQAIWKVPITDLFDFFECWRWPVKAKSYASALNKCRLVINVYKHGAGPSFDELKREAPEFLRTTNGLPSYAFLEPDYTDLEVSDGDLDQFSSAIEEFWRDMPAQVLQSQINDAPRWMEKALTKDLEARASRPTGR